MSVLVLIFNNFNQIIYLISVFLLVLLSIVRLFKYQINIVLALYTIFTLIIFFIYYLHNDVFINIDRLVRILLFGLILQIVRKEDVDTILSSTMPIIIMNCIAVVFFLFFPFLTETRPLGIFGSEISPGLVFEINYAAMLALVLFFNNRIIRITSVLAVLTVTILNFRTGLVPILARFSYSIFRLRLILPSAVISFYLLFYFLYTLGPTFLEQRYFSYKAFFSIYDFFSVYDKDFIGKIISDGFAVSPWGQSGGAILHSGFLESLAYDGSINTIMLFVIYFYAFSTNILKNRLLLCLLGIFMPVMSLSLGGLSFLSLLFSFVIAASIRYKN